MSEEKITLRWFGHLERMKNEEFEEKVYELTLKSYKEKKASC